MRHKKIKDLLSAYLDGELEAKQTRIVTDHLNTCAECQQELTAFKQLDTLSKDILPTPKDEEYWEDFPSRIKSLVEKSPPEARTEEGNMFTDSFIKPDKNIGVKAVVLPH